MDLTYYNVRRQSRKVRLNPDPSPPTPEARECAADAWLVGVIVYENILGGLHHTSFCYRAIGDGAAHEMYGKLYNERT